MKHKTKQTTKFLCLLILIFGSPSIQAQTWTQLGQGAGGQTMSLYSEIIPNSNPVAYDFYIGSDVAGVWKASNIPYTGITDVSNYHYNYISNHEIMRYAQKFYRPSASNGSYNSNYIFVGSSSGIHRIDNSVITPTNPLPAMTQIWNLKDSWVNDMFFTSDYVTPIAGPKTAYFVTGNTKIGSNEDIDGKDPDAFDFYWGSIINFESGLNNVKKVKLSGHTPGFNVYCMLVNDNNSAPINDDDFYVGAENGLHRFTYAQANSAFNSTTDLPTTTLITPPPGDVTSPYGVSSITRFDATRLLVTFYLTQICTTGCATTTTAPVYIYNTSSNQWSSLLINKLTGTAPNSSPTTHDFITDNNKDGLFHFTKLIPLLDNAITPNITGYLLFSEDNDHKKNNIGTNYFNGVYYCGIDGSAGANFYLPKGDWQAMEADDITGSTNDWGWNKAGRPCANPNSAIVIKDGNGDNNLIVGKTGNFFASKIPANPVSGNIWKQLFTKKTSKAAPCTGITNDVYENIGYVNTAAQSILPLSTGEVWYSERDRQMTYSDNNGLTSSQVTQYTTCPKIVLGSPIVLPCNNSNNNATVYGLADCFSLTKNTANKTDDKLYAGIAEGFGGAFGRGMVVQYDKTTAIWSPLNSDPAAVFCGDPLKILFAGTKYFAIIRDYISKDDNFHIYNPSLHTWGMVPNVVTKIIDAVFSPDGTKLFILKEGIAPPDPYELYVYDNNAGVFTSSSCSTTFNVNMVGKQLALYPYNNNTAFKVLCAFRDRTGFQSSTTNKLLEVYDSGNTSPCTTTVITNNCNSSGTLPSIFQTLIDYDDADGGVTAIEVNADISTIYVATVNYVAPLMQSRLYRTNYNPVTGIIDNCWYDITAHPLLPNKSIQFMNSIGSTYNNELVYACVRGMGEWINKIITPTQCGNYPNDLGSTPTSPTVPTNYNVNSNVSINTNTSFTDCSFAIASGTSITITNGATLTLTNCYLKACGNMWKGIIVQSGCTLIVTNSNIMDAQYGVEVKNGAILNCNGATFDRNYVGVYANNHTGANITIKGSTFKCTGCLTGNPLKTGYSGQGPDPLNNTYAGVLGLNATFNVGVNGASNNVFDGLYRGVSLTNCFTTVLKSIFKNMPIQTEYIVGASDGGGLAIYADVTTAGKLTQYGFGDYTGAPASFDNCYYGIYSKKGSLSVSSNTMTKMVNGINCSAVLTAQTIGINTNNIAASKVAIALLNNEPASSIGVSYNTLTVNGSSARGITVSEINATAAGRNFGLNCNNITVSKGLDGIYLNSTSRVNLQQNFVALPLLTAANGIKLNGTSYCNLTENSVNGNLSLSTTTCFSGSISDNNSFINNHANNTIYGFNFADGCPYTTYKGNTLNNNQIGLAIGNSGVIGIQTQAGNKWSGTLGSGYGAVNSNATSAGVVASQFIVHVTTPGLYRPVYSAPNESSSNPWFIQVSGTPFSATYANICDAYLAQSGTDNALRLDTMIASNSITSVDFEQELKYKVARTLQSKLSDNETLKNDNGLFENYFDSIQNTSAGSFNAIQFEIEHNTIVSAPANVDSLIHLKMDSLVLIDSLINSNPNSNFSIEKSNLIAELQLLIAQVSAYQQIAKTQKDSLFQVLQMQNQTISFSNNIEEIEKEINDFHFLYSDSLHNAIDTNRINSVIYIASLCPYAYGKGVYQARSELIRLGIDTIEYDDQANCSQLGYYRQSNASLQTNIQTPIFYVTPNPTKDNATFYFDKDAIGGTIAIKDACGKTLFSTKINSNQNNFNCSLDGFASGIYFASLVINNNVINTIKLIIIK